MLHKLKAYCYTLCRITWYGESSSATLQYGVGSTILHYYSRCQGPSARRRAVAIPTSWNPCCVAMFLMLRVLHLRHAHVSKGGSAPLPDPLVLFVARSRNTPSSLVGRDDDEEAGTKTAPLKAVSCGVQYGRPRRTHFSPQKTTGHAMRCCEAISRCVMVVTPWS